MNALLDLVCVRVSFQRYPRPANARVDTPPRSWGALPVATDPRGRYLLPLADDEATWIGLSVPDPAWPALVYLAIDTDTGESLDAVAGTIGPGRAGLVVPPASALDAIGRVEGDTRAITRQAGTTRTRSIEFQVYRASARRTVRSRPRPLAVHAASRGTSDDPQPVERASDTADPARWVPCEPHVTRVWLVDPETFTRETGVAAPGPMRKEDTYGGWRLP